MEMVLDYISFPDYNETFIYRKQIFEKIYGYQRV